MSEALTAVAQQILTGAGASVEICRNSLTPCPFQNLNLTLKLTAG